MAQTTWKRECQLKSSKNYEELIIQSLVASFTLHTFLPDRQTKNGSALVWTLLQPRCRIKSSQCQGCVAHADQHRTALVEGTSSVEWVFESFSEKGWKTKIKSMILLEVTTYKWVVSFGSRVCQPRSHSTHILQSRTLCRCNFCLRSQCCCWKLILHLDQTWESSNSRQGSRNSNTNLGGWSIVWMIKHQNSGDSLCPIGPQWRLANTGKGESIAITAMFMVAPWKFALYSPSTTNSSSPCYVAFNVYTTNCMPLLQRDVLLPRGWKACERTKHTHLITDEFWWHAFLKTDTYWIVWICQNYQHISSNLWHLSFNDLSTKAEFQATSGDGALHIPKDLRGQVMPWRQRLQRGVANQLFWLYTSKHYLWVTKIQTFSFTWVAAVLFVSKICV